MAADKTYPANVLQKRQDGTTALPTGGILDIESGAELRLNGTAITATAAEINAIAGGGLSAAELGVLDGVTPGTQAASKAIVNDANVNHGISKITALHIGTSGSETQVNATAAEINQHCDESAMYEIVTTTNVITADESGKTFFLNLAGGFTSTLPAPALGLSFRFIVKTAPTTAYIIVTNASANIMYGMMEERAGTAGVAGAGRDTFNFVANQSIIGDWVEFYSDGTNWYYHGMTDVAVGNTVAAT